jgi:hypothetical protein
MMEMGQSRPIGNSREHSSFIRASACLHARVTPEARITSNNFEWHEAKPGPPVAIPIEIDFALSFICIKCSQLRDQAANLGVSKSSPD